VSVFPGDSRIFGPLFADTPVAELFTDEGCADRLLTVEAALARAQGEVGVIPAAASERIEATAGSLEPDLERLAAATERQGFPVVGIVRQLRERVGRDAASWVHWGATTQDIMDTALLLQLREALAAIEADLDRLVRKLAELAETHRGSVMVGRTHSQHALPITLGLKVATWLAPLLRHRERLEPMRRRLLVVQLGGAAGTLASLGEEGPAVAEALARELGLGVPLLPWHTQRDAIGELAAWLAGISTTLGKVAQDLILLAQSEVGEAQESDDPSRGGSSTMPQKRNPIRCELVVAAARQNASLLGSVHQAGLQEHERGTHGWQLEWLSLPQMVVLSAGALRAALKIVEEMRLDPDAMRRNLEASRGTTLAEGASLLLAKHLPREEAAAVVKNAVAEALRSERHLIDVLEDFVDLDLDWSSVRTEERYLGSTQAFIDRVLGAARRG